jgi:hypothetical protein
MKNNECLFCENGIYEEFVSPSTDPRVSFKVNDLGLKTIAKNNWKILICNKCGNIQLFRQDLIEEE